MSEGGLYTYGAGRWNDSVDRVPALVFYTPSINLCRHEWASSFLTLTSVDCSQAEQCCEDPKQYGKATRHLCGTTNSAKKTDNDPTSLLGFLSDGQTTSIRRSIRDTRITTVKDIGAQH
jgi:hypothetical protein